MTWDLECLVNLLVGDESFILTTGKLTSAEGTKSGAITPALPSHSGLPCKQVKPCEHLNGIQNCQAIPLQSNVFHLRGSSAKGVATTRSHWTGMWKELYWSHSGAWEKALKRRQERVRRAHGHTGRRQVLVRKSNESACSKVLPAFQRILEQWELRKQTSAGVPKASGDFNQTS